MSRGDEWSEEALAETLFPSAELTRPLQLSSQCPNCDEVWDAPTPEIAWIQKFCPNCRLPLFLIAHKYRLEKRIGSGGFGQVFLASHVEFEGQPGPISPKRVIKIVEPDSFSNEVLLQRFLREVHLTSVLSLQNEHIVRVFDDFGKLENLGYYYVMEHLDGQPLSASLSLASLPTLGQCQHIAAQLCDGVAAAHRMGIIHRDLKPDNVFLIQRHGDPCFVKILDFGLARPTTPTSGRRLTSHDQVMGTPLYMSPEQCLQGEVGEAADIYSLGGVLFELLTGQTPFAHLAQSRENPMLVLFQAHIMEPPPSPRQLRPDRDIPEALEAVVLRCLEKKPDRRFASVQELADALEQSFQNKAPEAPTPQPKPEPALDPARAADLEAMAPARLPQRPALQLDPPAKKSGSAVVLWVLTFALGLGVAWVGKGYFGVEEVALNPPVRLRSPLQARVKAEPPEASPGARSPRPKAQGWGSPRSRGSRPKLGTRPRRIRPRPHRLLARPQVPPRRKAIWRAPPRIPPRPRKKTKLRRAAPRLQRPPLRRTRRRPRVRLPLHTRRPRARRPRARRPRARRPRAVRPQAPRRKVPYCRAQRGVRWIFVKVRPLGISLQPLFIGPKGELQKHRQGLCVGWRQGTKSTLHLSLIAEGFRPCTVALTGRRPVVSLKLDVNTVFSMERDGYDYCKRP